MTWKSIHLELARTEEYPDGSPRHIYALRLPLSHDGLIDAEEFRRHREAALVHRYWGEERPRAGYVIKTRHGWALSYERGQDDDEQIFHLETHPLRIGAYVTITDAMGDDLPMRIVSMEDVE
jgi:hypothetical protein